MMLLANYLHSVTRSWWFFFFCYCFIFQVGMGVNYYTPHISSWEWFPGHKGLISGIISACFGFGCVIFSILTTSIVNPENSRPQKLNVEAGGDDTFDLLFSKEIADRVPKMFRMCLYLWTLLSVISVLTINRNPAYEKFYRKQ